MAASALPLTDFYPPRFLADTDSPTHKLLFTSLNALPERIE